MFINRQIYKLTSATLLLFASSTISYGQFTATGVVPFEGTVLSNCSISDIVQGTLTPFGTNQSIGTSSVGGTLNVTTNGGALISVGPPSLTNSPANAELAETSSATINFNGEGLSNGDAAVPLDQGTTEVRVSLNLFPLDSDTGFPAGDYTAATTVTCEFTSPSSGILG